MNKVITECINKNGKLNGVFHLAGVPSAEMLHRKVDPIDYSILTPKILGALVLANTLKDIKLDFLVLYSSITSITGSIGQSDYCASNSFLNSFASWLGRVTKSAVFSLSWDAWALDSWQSKMSQVNLELSEALKKSRNENGIKFHDGLSVLKKVLSLETGHYIISRANPAETQKNILEFSKKIFSNSLNNTTHKKMRPELKTIYSAPLSEMEMKMCHLWEDLLGMSGIGRNDSFIELGGHSLLAVQLLGKIRSDFNASLTLKDILEEPFIGSICKKISFERDLGEMELEKLLEEIEAMSDIEVNQHLNA